MQHMVCQCQIVIIKMFYGIGRQIVWNPEIELLLIGNSPPLKISAPGHLYAPKITGKKKKIRL